MLIKDRFQDYIEDKFDTNILNILNEFIFYGIFIYYYYFGPIENSQQNFKILKYIILLLILRYIINYITEYTIIKDGKKLSYFQFNGKVAIFTLLILILSLENDNIYPTIFIIFSYALLSSASKYGYTMDNIFTVCVTYLIFSLKL